MSSGQAWVASFLEPIAGDLPAGRDARHEPEHERVRFEIAKQTGLQGKAVDWQQVMKDGELVLRLKAKDILIASYVALASAKLHGLRGLTSGLELLSSLLFAFPEGLHPQRTRARANALVWLSERVAELAMPEQCTSTEAEALKGAYGTLSANMRERLGDDSPSLTDLGRLVERLALSASAPVDLPREMSEADPDPRTVEGERDAPLAASAGDDASWLAPIPGASAAGADASQHDAYFAAQAEVAKLQSLDGQAPDWRAVLAHSIGLLTQHTKDFVVASYLLVALTETEGLRGLLRGTSLLAGMLDCYWDEGFPPLSRLKRRTNALGWSIERVAAALPRLAPTSAAERRALEEAVSALEIALVSRLPGSDAASLSSWRSALPTVSEAQLDAPTGSVPPVSAATTAVAPSPAVMEVPAAQPESVRATDVAPEVAVLDGVSGIDAFLESSGQRLVEAAVALFEAGQTDARAYRLLRIGLWLELDELPAAQTEPKQRGRTRVRPPERRAREALGAMVASGRWDAALLQSEGLLRQNPLWLETCWLSARALGELGDGYAAALAAVTSESRALVVRLPQLLELQFLDGTPFVSSEAAAWFSGGISGNRVAEVETDQAAEAWRSAVQAALGAGGGDAIERIDELLRRVSSARESFCKRLALAKSMEEVGRLDSAAYIYLGLERDIDNHALERWEPELALEVFSRLWSLLGRRALTVSAADAQRICARLANLSPFALG